MTRPSKVPKSLQPMLATLIDAPFDSKDWVFETKWTAFGWWPRSRTEASPDMKSRMLEVAESCDWLAQRAEDRLWTLANRECLRKSSHLRGMPA